MTRSVRQSRNSRRYPLGKQNKARRNNGIIECIYAASNDTPTQLSRLSISTDPDTDAYAWIVTLQLADRFELTLYDAAYLELASRRRLPLATLDRESRDASAALGITLLGVDPAKRHRKNARLRADYVSPQTLLDRCARFLIVLRTRSDSGE